LITYDDAVEEAHRFGWIDSLVKRLDGRQYALKFTPRKPDGKWSAPNRRRYEKLAAAGLLSAAGISRPPTSRSGDAPPPSRFLVPRYIREVGRANAAASRFLEQVSPSQRRLYAAWIDAAKKEETKRENGDRHLLGSYFRRNRLQVAPARSLLAVVSPGSIGRGCPEYLRFSVSLPSNAV
jgi:uncharacterized protein YdeI (YjbR/CyaY-like superfamily)